MGSRSLIVDASPLILLSRARHLTLLSSLARNVVAPTAVVEELRAGAHIDATAVAVERADWIEIVGDLPIPPAIQAWDLDPGESQVLAHALANPGSEAVPRPLSLR